MCLHNHFPHHPPFLSAFWNTLDEETSCCIFWNDKLFQHILHLIFKRSSFLGLCEPFCEVRGNCSRGKLMKAVVIGSLGGRIVCASCSGWFSMMAVEIGLAASVYWCRRASVNKRTRKSRAATVAALQGVHTALSCMNNFFNIIHF